MKSILRLAQGWVWVIYKYDMIQMVSAARVVSCKS